MHYGRGWSIFWAVLICDNQAPKLLWVLWVKPTVLTNKLHSWYVCLKISGKPLHATGVMFANTYDRFGTTLRHREQLWLLWGCVWQPGPAATTTATTGTTTIKWWRSTFSAQLRSRSCVLFWLTRFDEINGGRDVGVVPPKAAAAPRQGSLERLMRTAHALSWANVKSPRPSWPKWKVRGKIGYPGNTIWSS